MRPDLPRLGLRSIGRSLVLVAGQVTVGLAVGLVARGLFPPRTTANRLAIVAAVVVAVLAVTGVYDRLLETTSDDGSNDDEDLHGDAEPDDGSASDSEDDDDSATDGEPGDGESDDAESGGLGDSGTPGNGSVTTTSPAAGAGSDTADDGARRGRRPGGGRGGSDGPQDRQ